MKYLLYIFLYVPLLFRAQDKIFFRNGTSQTGQLLSVGKEVIHFRNSDTSAAKQINKKDVLMIEDVKGTRYIYGRQEKKAAVKDAPVQLRRNSVGMQPVGLFVGRLVLSYERLSDDGKVGFAFPFSLSFNPYRSSFTTFDTTASGIQRIKGINIIAGAEANFYFDINSNTRFYIGPRLRYGTDVFLGNIEAATLQTQVGWRFGNPAGLMSQHLAFGFGVVNVFAAPGGVVFNPNSFYPWGSFTYRIGFNW